MTMHEGEVAPAMTEEEAKALAQQLYVAYYGRPADPGGLDFWTGEIMNSANLDNAVRNFGAGAEYNELSKDKTNEELLTARYQQMFNRDPDQAGLDFYLGRLERGESTLASIAKQVADGAVDEDVTTLANKVAVANAFTEAVRDSEGDVVYDGSQIVHAAALLADVTDAEGAVAAGEAAVADLIERMDGGQDYILKSMPRDLIESGTGDDTFTATSDTVNEADAIQDYSTTDHDTLTITNTHTVEAISVRNVEYVNIVQNLFDGVEIDDNTMMPAEGGPEIKLAKVKGATVTVSSERLSYDGRAYITGVYDNTLVAGVGLSDLLIVGDLDDGAVDLGSVKEAEICTIAEVPPGSAADAKDETGPTIIINGDVKLRVKGSDADQTEREDSGYTVAPTYTLMGTADATVTLNPARTEGNAGDDVSALVPFEVAGGGSLTLMMDSVAGAKISNKSTGDLMVVTKDVAGADVSGVESAVTFSEVRTGGADAITVADGQMIVFSKAQNVPMKIMGSTAEDGSTTANLVITATDLASITFDDAASATLTVVGSSEKATKALVGALNSATVPVSVISSLEDLTVDFLAAAKADFSGVDGKLAIVGITVDSEVTGGSGENTVTLVSGSESFSKTLGYTGGAGKDSIVATNLGESGRVEANLGAGNDSIVLRTVADGTRIAVDGGAGHDSLVLMNMAEISEFEGLHTNDIEFLVFKGANDDDTDVQMEGVQGENLIAAMSPAQLTAQDWIIALEDAATNAGRPGADSVTITVIAGDAETIDLSNLRVLDPGKVTFAITGDSTKATTIVGSSVNDTITGGAHAGDTMSGGGGADTFVFAAGDSYREASADATPAVTLGYDTIMDFSTSQKDVISFGTAVGVNAPVVSMAFVGTEAAAVFEDAEPTVMYKVEDGVLTLDGLRSDLAMADTLEEWLILARDATAQDSVLAFVFEGDTYIHQEGGAGTENLIKLEGVTGITLIADGAAEADIPADAVLIA